MISDDELLCFHYEDGLSAERRAQITQSLAADASLRLRLTELRRVLTALQQMPLPAPAELTRRRWRQALDLAASRDQARPRQSRRYWEFALACTLLLLGVGIGMRVNDSPQVAPAFVQAADPALLRGVRAHLSDTRMVLAQWTTSAPAQRDALLREVLAQNRAYIGVAERTGDLRLARVLRAFEPVLRQLDEAATDPEQGAGARAQLDFELGAMQTKLQRTPSNGVQRL